MFLMSECIAGKVAETTSAEASVRAVSVTASGSGAPEKVDH